MSMDKLNLDDMENVSGGIKSSEFKECTGRCDDYFDDGKGKCMYNGMQHGIGNVCLKH